MLTLSWTSCGASGENTPAATLPPSVKQDRPTSFANDNEMLDYIQKVHLNYMWDGAESNSGLAPERRISTALSTWAQSRDTWAWRTSWEVRQPHACY